MRRLKQLIEQLRAQIATELEQRAKQYEPIDQVRSACLAGDAVREPTTAEAAQVRAAQELVAATDGRISELRAQLATFESELAREQAAEELSREFTPAAPRPKYDEVINRGDTTEPRTYTLRANLRGDARFFQDAYNATERGNRAAQERINRHGREVEVHKEISERALTSGGAAGLVIPQYLTDMAAPVLRSGRPFANAVNRHQIPDGGMVLIVPRGSVGATVAAQATEGTQVSDTDEAWLNLQVPVVTIAGEQDVSRQTLERGEGMDDIIFNDLALAYASQLDNYVLNGSGSSGQPLGALQTTGIGAATAFGAAVSLTNQQLKIAGAITSVTSAGAGLYPRVLVMSPRRWGWYMGTVDSAGRPAVKINDDGAYNAAAVINAPGKMSADDDPLNGMTFVGLHSSGLPIISDLNVPTNVGTNNEDVMFAADTRELHLWEDGDGMPKQLRFEQTQGNKLVTTLVVYDYAAFTGGRYPGAVAKVGGLDTVAGQGLIAPSF